MFCSKSDCIRQEYDLFEWESSLSDKSVRLRVTRAVPNPAWKHNQVYQLYCWSLERAMDTLPACDRTF
jgi:hypothetical protein